LHLRRRLPDVTVSIKRMSAGDGYRYLMRTVVAGDGVRDMSSPLTRYYTESGNPPGRWLGAGLAGLNGGHGLEADSIASEEQMFRLFGMGNDPVSGEQLGNRPYRIDADDRGSVAGFDLTFSAPKSISVWWAVADATTQAAIVDAHHAAMHACVEFLEAEVAATRIGKNGVAQADVRGLVAAAFDHWDSRAGDPQLHTHLVVANRVQTDDGRWRTLDSRALYRSVVAVSETYNALLADELTRRLGVTWEPRARRHSAVPAWEITGVPDKLIAEFSQRAHAIEGHKNDLVRDFVASHGRQPTATEVLRLRQQATLATRPDKELKSLGELCVEWRERAGNVLGMDAGAWAKTIGDEPRIDLAHGPSAEVRHELGAAVLAAVQEKRSTWSRWNLHAEASRQLAGVRFATVDTRFAATAQVVDAAIDASVLLTPPLLAPTPPALCRSDGTSMFAHKHAEVYTSRALLDAESRLLDAGRDTSGPVVPAHVVEQAVAKSPPGHRYPLGPSQAAALTAIASSGRILDVLVGPAGTGKTVTLAGLRAAWETGHGPGSVVGLAPSAAAADVLASELGVATENTAKWLTEADREATRLAEIDKCRVLLHRLAGRNPRAVTAVQNRIDELASEVERWRLRRGQLVMIDEASLAGTVTLDRIVDQARTVGDKVVLVGDWAQLSAVDAGGAFAMLVHDRPDVPELVAVRRFTHRWERAASWRLRTGDSAVIVAYEQHDRIRAGEQDGMLDAAYQAWLADEAAGRRSLLIAGDTATVEALNERARSELVARGLVRADGVSLSSGAVAGVGDRVITRHNDRTLSTGRGFVKNGDTWIVTRAHRDGAITVQRAIGRQQAKLPADYVAAHVDLGYATTAYRAQGATVDTSHAVVTAAAMTREALYVAMTRGRATNTAYVITDPTDACEIHGTELLTGRDVLAAVLRRTGAENAAHAVMRSELDRVSNVAQLADEYETIATEAQRPRWSRLLAAAGLTPEQVRKVEQSPAYGALTTALRRAEAHGLPVEERLVDVVAARSLTDARDIAAVLHDRHVQSIASAPTRRERVRSIAGLIPVTMVSDPRAQLGLDERGNLIEQRAKELVQRAIRDGEPWIRRLGPPPSDSRLRSAWLRAAEIVAAYRDRNVVDESHGSAIPDRDVARTTARLAQQHLSRGGRAQSDLQASSAPTPVGVDL
jgi:conjugative relaxase-like TrwC/TraI family protein